MRNSERGENEAFLTPDPLPTLRRVGHLLVYARALMPNHFDLLI
jgi:hypothetical protein